jgi:negative regulator of sigma E activity
LENCSKKISFFAKLFSIKAVYNIKTMKTEDHNDPVWDLIRTRQKPVARPDFVAQVMQAIASVPQDAPVAEPSNVVAFPTRRKLWVGIGSLAAAAAVVLGIYLNLAPSSTTQTVAKVDPEVPVLRVETVRTPIVDDTLEQEFAAVQDMHTIITVDDPSQLNDAQLIALIN